MRQPTDRPAAPTLSLPADATVGALMRRVAIAALLLVGLTVLASVALATTR
jgi:hypothetical protein